MVCQDLDWDRILAGGATACAHGKQGSKDQKILNGFGDDFHLSLFCCACMMTKVMSLD